MLNICLGTINGAGNCQNTRPLNCEPIKITLTRLGYNYLYWAEIGLFRLPNLD